MNATHHKDDRHHLGDLAGTAKMIGLGMASVGVVGAVIFWLAGGLDIDQLTRGWLVAFCFGLTISLGGLFWTMVQHATRAGWSVAVRRISEAVAANLKWIWILFIPILIAPFTTHIYHWMHPVHDGHVDPILLIGGLVGQELYEQRVPIVVVDAECWQQLRTGVLAKIDAGDASASIALER